MNGARPSPGALALRSRNNSMTDYQCPKLSRSIIGHWVLVIFLLGLSRPASAQPAPNLTAISPDWIQRGTTGRIVFSGENLGNVTGFIFSGASGLTATNIPPPVAAKSVVTIESDLGGISQVDPQPKKDDKRLVASV